MDYDKIAGTYDNYEDGAITLWRLGYPEVCKSIGLLAGKTILDYGCGSGTFSRFLRDQGAKVTGVDVSEKMIEVAKENAGDNISYHCISSGGLEFLRDGLFDHIVTNFVLCTIGNGEEIKSILGEFYRVLKITGSAVILNSNWDRSNGREFISFRLQYCNNLTPGQRINAIMKSDPPIIFEDYFWPIENYRKFLEEAGFAIAGISEPLANNPDIAWKDESISPPYYIMTANKHEKKIR